MPEGKKILITGASGFVGNHMLNFLSDKNVVILGIDKNRRRREHVGKKNLLYEFRSLDLLDFSRLKDNIRSFMPDIIMHFASLSNVAESWEKPDIAYTNNTNIFLNLLEAVRQLELDCKILSVGSSEEYGRVDEHNLPLTEHSPLNPISPYAVARTSQEMLSKVFVDGYRMKIFLTRSFNHVGPGQASKFFIPSMVKQILEANVKNDIQTGDLSIIRDFVDVRDVVRAYWMILDRGTPGSVYNICSGEGRMLRDIVLKIIEMTGKKINIIKNPDRFRPADNQAIIGSYDKIYNELGWEPQIHFDQSLEDVVRERS